MKLWQERAITAAITAGLAVGYLLMLIGVSLLVLTFATSVYAEEPTPAWPVNQRPMANAISNYALAAQVSLDTLHAFRSDDRKGAFCEQLVGVGITLGADTALKVTTNRMRPDRSDDRSMPSGHSGLAAASGGWSFAWSLPITELVMVTRMGANKHHPTDTIAGAAIGIASRLVARKVCK